MLALEIVISIVWHKCWL